MEVDQIIKLLKDKVVLIKIHEAKVEELIKFHKDKQTKVELNKVHMVKYVEVGLIKLHKAKFIEVEELVLH